MRRLETLLALVLILGGCVGYGGSMRINVSAPSNTEVYLIPLDDWELEWSGKSSADLLAAARGGEMAEFSCGSAPTTCEAREQKYYLVAVVGNSVRTRVIQPSKAGERFEIR